MIYIAAVGMLNALGQSADEIAHHLQQGVAPGMRPRRGWLQPEQPCWLGGIDAPLPDLPAAFAQHASRNNQLLLAAIAQIRPQIDAAITRFGRDRVAGVLGTSTSGLQEADRQVSQQLRGQSAAGYHYYQQELGDPARFLSAYLELSGPAFTLSTACSSSSRAIISGHRLIEPTSRLWAVLIRSAACPSMALKVWNLCQQTAANRLLGNAVGSQSGRRLP